MVAPSRRQEEGDKDFVARTYRDFTSRGTWVAFAAASEETDLYIRAEQDLTREALEAIRCARRAIEGYIREHPDFRTSLEPLPFDPEAPPIVQDMLLAAQNCRWVRWRPWQAPSRKAWERPSGHSPVT